MEGSNSWRPHRCKVAQRARWRTVVAVALAIIVGVNVGLFIHLASLSSVLDPDPPFAPGANLPPPRLHFIHVHQHFTPRFCSHAHSSFSGDAGEVGGLPFHVGAYPLVWCTARVLNAQHMTCQGPTTYGTTTTTGMCASFA